VLSHIPIRDELLARLKQLDAGRPYRVFDVTRMPSGRMFYQKMRAEEVLSKLFVRKSASGPEHC